MFQYLAHRQHLHVDERRQSAWLMTTLTNATNAAVQTAYLRLRVPQAAQWRAGRHLDRRRYSLYT